MTINLDPKQTEEKILEFWKNKQIYEKVKKLRKNGKKFYFLDGPPYATGYIHMGTAFNKILKDFYIRFFRMLGFDVWDQPGYDTHGVPIENKVEQLLKFKSKQDIEKFGIENFIKECKKFATEFIDVMGDQFSNLGVWMDWKNPYLTLKNDYIEGAWFTFKQGFKKGFLYKGNYPVHVCPHCETAVAYNEIDYEQVTDPAIFVKLRIKNRPKEFLLIWTTTPWTLPSNTGVMVKPSAEYVKVKCGEETLILAKQLLETVMKKVGIEKYEIVETIKGKDLEGIEYEHPLSGLFPFHSKLKNACRIVLSEQFVTLEDGSGLVHTAPGHGQEDYKVGIENGLPAISPIKMNGEFNEESGKYSGIFVKDADKMIIQELKDRGLMLYEEKVTHDYPMCWRCKSALILISVPQWFFKVTEIRKKLIEENKKVNWTPDWAGQRFENWLESLGDWPISRQRYWGIPLPIWVCEKCNNIKVIGSRDELPEVPEDFHKPYIDKIVLKCDKCKGVMRRVPDVLDVWFDSGVASWASLGYPKNKKLFEKMWPADFILEGPDQIRGWWNSQMLTSIITFDKRPFLDVLFHGFVLDAHGIKMSKSKGNIIRPEDVVKKYGRDITRFYFLYSPPWDDYHFKWEDAEDIAKSFVIVRNTFNFVKTYVTNSGRPRNLKIEDKWLLSKLNSLVDNCTGHCKNYNVHKAAKEILDFILNDFSRWYVKIVRDRVWPTYEGSDKNAAFYTLLTVTESLSRLMSPFCPFLSEDIYQSIVKPLEDGKESVHMNDWPKVKKKLIDKDLEENMIIVKKIVEACLLARQRCNLKLRWPIKEVLVVSGDKKLIRAAKELKTVILSMCNAKSVRIVKEVPKKELSEVQFDYGKVYVDKKLDEDLIEEALVRELVRKVQEMRKENKFQVRDNISLTLNSDKKTNEMLNKYSKVLTKEVGAKKVIVGKIMGNFIGNLKFEDKSIDIAFDRL